MAGEPHDLRGGDCEVGRGARGRGDEVLVWLVRRAEESMAGKTSGW